MELESENELCWAEEREKKFVGSVEKNEFTPN